MELEDGGGGKPTQWLRKHGVYLGAPETLKSLPAAIYQPEETDDGIGLKKIKFPSDNLSRLPGLPIDFIMDQINDFWERKDVFSDLGLVHKRGILLYGPAGCGKTSIIRMLCDDIMLRDGIIININNIPIGIAALQTARGVEASRPIMTIIEDIDDYLSDKDNDPSPKLLSMLDGEMQVDHVVHLATTNKPEELEDRIIRRPGRFDLVIGLNYPIREAREAYLTSYLSGRVPEEQLQAIVDRTGGFGLAHLRELVVSWHCLAVPLEDTLARLNTSITQKHKVAKGKKRDDSLGFTVNFADEKQAA